MASPMARVMPQATGKFNAAATSMVWSCVSTLPATTLISSASSSARAAAKAPNWRRQYGHQWPR